MERKSPVVISSAACNNDNDAADGAAMLYRQNMDRRMDSYIMASTFRGGSTYDTSLS